MVVDASVMVSWHFPDERNTQGDRILEWLRKDQARMPAIWWFELRNVLLTGELRKRATAVQTEEFLEFVSTLRIHIDDLTNDHAIMALARRHRLTFYDAAYLELAQRESIPLATLDQALARAAAAEGIALIGAP